MSMTGKVSASWWREANFLRLLTARSISMWGFSFAPVALAFGVLDLPGSSASTVAAVVVAGSLAELGFTPVAGMLADRYPRQRVLTGGEAIAALAAAVLGVMLLTGHAPLWALLAMAAVEGCGIAITYPTLIALVPDVVGEEHLQPANGILSMTSNITLALGLVSGGAVVVAIGSGPALLIAAAAYVASAALMLTVKSLSSAGGDRSSTDAAEQDQESTWQQIVAGWHAVRSRRWLWIIVVQYTFVVAAYIVGHMVLGPVLANEELGGAGTWSRLLAIESVGLLLGGLVSLRLPVRRPGLVVVLLTFVPAATYVALAASAPLPVIALAMFSLGFCFELITVIWMTTLQRLIPPAVLGRVLAIDAVGSLALGPLASALAGPAADRFGVHVAIFGCALAIIVPTIAALSSRSVRQLHLPPAAENEPCESL